MKTKQGNLRVYELFAGIGAPHEAIRQNNLPYKVVGACEKDKYARAIYRYQFKPKFEVDHDAKGLLPTTDFDCLIFGWPCQDNSIAGKRAGQKEGTRSGLLGEAVRILRIKKPSYFIAENVPGLFSVNNGNDFYETIRMFTDVGYDCQWQVLNTRWFLPQNRERIYIVGHLREKPRPKVFPVTEDDCKPIESFGTSRGKRKRICSPSVNAGYGKMRGGGEMSIKEDNGIMRVDENAPHYQDRIYSEEGISPALPTGVGGNHQPFVAQALTETRTEEAKQVRRETKDRDFSPRRGKELVPRNDEIGNTVTAAQGKEHFIVKGHYGNQSLSETSLAGSLQSENQANPQSAGTTLTLENNSIRRLTPIECERLQGFKDNHTAKGIDDSGNEITISDTQRYKTCGNAMSVPVVRMVLERLVKIK